VDRVVTTRTATRQLPTREDLVKRARRVRLVITDVDGVLTDAGVYYSDRGEELKRFNVRDGMGVERLRNAGIATAFLTRERSPAVRARAEKLRLSHVYLGVDDKLAHLPTILRDTGFAAAEIAFIGDDVNDIGLLVAVGEQGLTGAPRDAMPEVVGGVMHRCAAAGGQGAFRDFAEWILELRAE
jgi:3-deoxy-D-manno-octulosonate 8-phosphate phosphatase (KDO 8-P phosphatase)